MNLLKYFIRISLDFQIDIWFSLFQGSVILVNFNHGKLQDLPSEYYACVITAVSSSFLEFVLTCVVTARFKSLKLIAIKHIMDEKGIEIDFEGQPIKQKASLRRLVQIAKPVSG